MKKIVLICATLLFLIIPSSKVFAASDFLMDSSTNYFLSEDGHVEVRQNVEITNLKTKSFVPQFTFSTYGYTPFNIGAREGSEPLKVDSISTGVYQIKLKTPGVGLGKKTAFELYFEDNSLFKKDDDFWSFTIPVSGSSQDFDNYTVKVNIPKSLGKTLVYPTPYSVFDGEKDSTIYTFTKDSIGPSPISFYSAAPKKYTLNLHWNLTNPTFSPQTRKIALAPNTLNQRSELYEIEPRPQEILRDEDGNLYAVYPVGPLTQIEVKAKFGIYVGLIDKYLDNAQNSEAFRRAEVVYQKTTDSLSYDSEASGEFRVLGSSSTASSFNQARCLDYTSLFNALSKESGLKSRVMVGTIIKDSSLPQSYENQELHSWPEYLDESTGSFMPIDPTRGDNGGGNIYLKTTTHDQIAISQFNSVDEISQEKLPVAWWVGSEEIEGSKPVEVLSAKDSRIPSIIFLTPLAIMSFCLYYLFHVKKTKLSR